MTNRIGGTEKAERDLGYKWTIDLEEGMKTLIEWRKADQEAMDARRRAVGMIR